MPQQLAAVSTACGGGLTERLGGVLLFRRGIIAFIQYGTHERSDSK